MSIPKTKKERIAEAVAKAVGADRQVAIPSVDFSDPNRPKTCLEVDFSILPTRVHSYKKLVIKRGRGREFTEAAWLNNEDAMGAHTSSRAGPRQTQRYCVSLLHRLHQKLRNQLDSRMISH